jgi:hypothetical protein
MRNHFDIGNDNYRIEPEKPDLSRLYHVVYRRSHRPRHHHQTRYHRDLYRNYYDVERGVLDYLRYRYVIKG